MSDSSHPNIKVPEGCVLLKEAELKQMGSKINEISNVINQLKAETFSTSTDLRNISKKRSHSAPQSSAELVSKFKAKCADSTLRSDIENAKTECNINLKKCLQDVQKKQRMSQNDLKKKFESSITKCQELYKDKIISELKAEDLQLDQDSLLLDLYRSCLQEDLLPKMDVMYRQHCQKIDTSLQQWLADCISGEARQSDEVKHKLKNINDLLQNMALTSQHNIVETGLEEAVRKVSNFTVRTVPRELTTGELIDQAILSEDYAEALNQALLCLDLEVLKSTLERMDAESVFSSSDNIPTPLILSLWQQLLSEDLIVDYQLKGPYLLTSVQALDLSCDIVQGNIQPIRDQLRTLLEKIDITAPLVPRNEFSTFRNMKWSAGQIIQQLR